MIAKNTSAKAKVRAKVKAKANTKTAPHREAEMDPRLARVAKVFAKDERVTTGKMMASYGLKVDGRIFVMQVRGAFVAKLPKDRVDALVAEGTGERFEPGRGRVMKEWIAIVGHEDRWLALAREARRFVGS